MKGENRVERFTTHFKRSLQNEPYYDARYGWDDYDPAYRYAYKSYEENPNAKFEDLETRLEAGWGIALKMDDGNTARACEVAIAALLDALGTARDDPERLLLAGLSNVNLRNRRNAVVGRLGASPELRRNLPHGGA